MPTHATDLDALIRDCDLSFVRDSGPGGQHRNKRETGVRLVHRLHGYGARIHVQRFHHRRDRPRTDGVGDAGPGGRAELEQLIPKLEK